MILVKRYLILVKQIGGVLQVIFQILDVYSLRKENENEIVIFGFFDKLNLGVVDTQMKSKNTILYPNPIKTNFKLIYNLQKEENIEICLYNLSEKKL